MKTYQEDLEHFLGLLKRNENFSLSRYGDGEWMAMNTTPASPGMGEWQINPVDPRTDKSRVALLESLKYKHDNYYVGICPCYTDILLASGQSPENVTYANIFCNKNYETFKTKFVEVFKEKQIVFVCNKDADLSKLPFTCDTIYHVEDNAWIENYDLYDTIVNDDHTGKVFLFAAGPLSKILTGKLWMVDKTNTYIDIGSSLDEFIGNKHHPRAYYLGVEPYCSMVCPCPDYVPSLTFIVPSIGRKSIKDSLESLTNQTDGNWRCRVGFDGLSEDQVSKELLIDDPRIEYYYYSDKLGQKFWGHPGAGAVRNELMSYEGATWYAFLDDDDTVAPDYVHRFNRQLKEHPFMDMMIFRMIYHSRYGTPDLFTVPPIHIDDPYTLTRGEVGISFCIKKEFTKTNNISFITSDVEDLDYVHQFVNNNAEIHLSDIVGYFVGGKG